MQTIVLNCYVQPNAKTTEYVGIYNNHHKFKLNSLPIEGRANQELIKFIAHEFKVSKKQVGLIKGKLSRYKVIAINAPFTAPSWFEVWG